MKFASAFAHRLTAAVLMAFAGVSAAQESYPNKSIHFVIPYPPAGGADPVARLVAQGLSERWGQPVLVENRAGGNTIIAHEFVSKAAPDGYTVLMTANTFAITASLYRLPYDPIKDFVAVATVSKSHYLLVVHPSVPANNLKELIALAKSKPGQLNYGSSATGGTPHLGTELLCIMTGIKMQHVPYKGTGPMTTDLLGGQIQVAFNNAISAAVPLVKSGRLKAIAYTGDKRLPDLPQVPTFAESGMPDFDLITWYAIMTPAGTPKAVTDKISNDMTALLAGQDTIKALEREAQEPFVSTPAQTAALIKSEIAKYAKIIKTANIKLD